MQPPSEEDDKEPVPIQGEPKLENELVIGPRPAKLEASRQVGVPIGPQALLSPSGQGVVSGGASPPSPKPAVGLIGDPLVVEGSAKPGAARMPAKRSPFKLPSLKFDKFKAGAVGVFLGTLALPLYLALASQGFRDAGVGAFIGLWFGLAAIATANLRLYLSKAHPTKVGLAALAAGLGACAILVASIFARWMHADATNVKESNEVLEAGMREYLIGEAQASGRAVALFGLVGIPGFILGALNLALVLGNRRIAESAARLKKQKGPSSVPVWVALVGSSFVFLYGFFTDVYAVFLSVNRVPNPREKLVEELAQRLDKGELVKGCEELERTLSPTYVSESILDAKLPKRVTYAKKCVELQIDDLPIGSACKKASEKLLATETVRIADMKAEVRKACKGD